MAADTKSERRLEGEIVRKLLRKGVLGNRREQLDTVVGWFATDERERARELLVELADDPESPVDRYGEGDYSNVFVSDYEAAKEFVGRHGIDTTWL